MPDFIQDLSSDLIPDLTIDLISDLILDLNPDLIIDLILDLNPDLIPDLTPDWFHCLVLALFKTLRMTSCQLPDFIRVWRARLDRRLDPRLAP